MPESVLEAELFGDNTRRFRGQPVWEVRHRRKRHDFSGRDRRHADGAASRLLQVLENNDLQNDLQNSDLRTGAGDEGTSANVRILASSSANLERALAEKQLREDLYYRLSAFTVQVPPLRQRKDEIATLLRYFMHKLARHYSLPARAFPSSMLDRLPAIFLAGKLEGAGSIREALPGRGRSGHESERNAVRSRWLISIRLRWRVQ